MKIGKLLARTEFRQLQNQLGEQSAEIERLRRNGVAQAYSLGQEIELLQGRIAELDRHAGQLAQELAGRRGELDQALLREQQLGARIAELDQHASRNQQQLDAARAELQQAGQHGEQLQAQLDALQQQLEQQGRQLGAELEQGRQREQALEARIKESGEEGELLLLQLHQVQEELEALFLADQENRTRLQTLQAELQASEQQRSAAVTARDEQARLAQQRHEQLQALNKEKDALARDQQALVAERDARQQELAAAIAARDEQARLAATHQQALEQLRSQGEGALQEAQQENELLLLQLHQVQEELESLFLADKEAKTRVQADAETRAAQQARQQAIEQELAAAIAARDEQARLAATHQQALEQLRSQGEGLAHEAQQENELLLLQLHQVQEELEHYFLEHQKLQRDNEALALRWQRLEQRYPDYLDYARIGVVAVDAVSDSPRVDWKVFDVTVAGVNRPELSFATVLEDGRPGFVLPAAAAGDEDLVLIPRELTLAQATAAIARFRAIGTAQWRQLLAAATAIEQFFASLPPASALPEDFDPVFWRQALLPLVADLRALPGVFRFDRVQLKRELINPDYEHLWLVFHGASYGRKYAWPKLEVRIGAAHVQPGKFSRHPKIELPRIDGKLAPFNSWFEESFDDFGGKLELRFDLGRHRFDAAVWSKLDADDQGMLLSLIAVLPLALARMQAGKVAISRPWESWIRLGGDTLEVLRKRLLEARAPKQQSA